MDEISELKRRILLYRQAIALLKEENEELRSKFEVASILVSAST